MKADKSKERLKNKVCNMCGKSFDEWDYHIGYDSKYDLNRLRLNLCIECFDKVLDFIKPQCKINPLVEVKILGEFDYEKD